MLGSCPVARKSRLSSFASYIIASCSDLSAIIQDFVSVAGRGHYGLKYFLFINILK